MRDVEDEKTDNLLEKIDSLYSELRYNFENNLQRIKDSNYLISYDSQYNSEVKERKPSSELEQQLINDVEIEDIIDQKEYVNERQKNLVDLDNALNSIQNMSENIYKITQEDGVKINNIFKQQVTHRDNVNERINVDIQRTAELNEGLCKKLVFFGFIAVVLAFCVVGVYYMTKHKSD